MQQFYPNDQTPKYAIQAVLPRLNTLGEQGWELVQMEPVRVGVNGDVMVSGGETRYWTNVYLCVFKRWRERS